MEGLKKGKYIDAAYHYHMNK